MPTLSCNISPLSVGDLVNRFKSHRLNLEPGFQRKSVWNYGQRQKLVESILSGYNKQSIA